MTIAPMPSLAQAPAGWRLLAYKTVGVGTDRDTITVSTKRHYGQVQLCAINAPIHIRDFDLRFGNGDRQPVRVRKMIAAGSCTRAIPLNGYKPRRIARVSLVYERIQRDMRTPLVRVMAR